MTTLSPVKTLIVVNPTKERLRESYNKLVDITKIWKTLHSKGITLLNQFSSNLGSLQAVSDDDGKKIGTSRSFQLPQITSPSQTGLTAEQTFILLSKLKTKLDSVRDSMQDIYNQAERHIRSSSVEDATGKGKSSLECTPLDYFDFISVTLKMHMQEFQVKDAILEDVNYSTKPDVLNTYIIVWTVQPHMDMAKAEEIRRRVDIDTSLIVTTDE